MFLKFSCFILVLLCSEYSIAQSCTGALSSFPYTEDFEATNGNWIPGGTASDWAWGTPVKPVITGAGEGAKSWVIGGLTNSFYNNGENSFLQSPCFNLTTLVNPRISFKIFWETERKFDGAALQYSTNGGTIWNFVGTANSNSTCQGENWYNTTSVNFLGSVAGWSGNVQSNSGSCLGGTGSGVWLNASHNLSAMAGQANVKFRFVFGAGTTCNAYDGFAIDDVNIFEAPLNNTANFSYTCKPARTVDFSGQAVCATSSSWIFGDIGSGASNTSTAANPAHTFSAPGTYTVTLTTAFQTGPPSTVSKQITVLDVTANQDQSIICNGGQTAMISASAAGSSAPYSYVWNTNPVQTTPIISNLGAGSYTVTVFSGTACTASAVVIVTEPQVLRINPVTSPQKCLVDNGSIMSNVSGGTLPYNYLWSTGSSAANLNNLPAGNYSLQVTDSKGCVANANNIMITSVQEILNINLGINAFICPGEKLVLDAGNFASYRWQDSTTAPTFTVTKTGTYSVAVTDNSGCRGSGSVKVTVDCSDIYFPTAFTPNGDGKNELFGPAGNNLSAVKNYTLEVYNRYGETVFQSKEPFRKWDGNVQGTEAGNGFFVWVAAYTVDGKKQFKKGSVIRIK